MSAGTTYSLQRAFVSPRARCTNTHVASYDTEGNGEMPLSELATAMGDIVGLTKEDVMPMFSQSGRTEEVGFI